MPKCSFCGKNIIPGTGKMFVMKSGAIRYFCSRKCERSWEMGRDSKKLKWTKFYEKRVEHIKEEKTAKPVGKMGKG